jgi:hypothetical protein
MDTAPPEGAGGVIIGLRLRRIRRPVDQALANVIKKSVVQTDDVSAEELKAGLAEAQTWDGG